MKFVTINTQNIHDEASFHVEFKHAMQFFDGYGMNWDAFIDCLSDIGGGLTGPEFNTEEPVCIELVGTEDFQKRQPELFSKLINSVADINKRFMQAKETKHLFLKIL